MVKDDTQYLLDDILAEWHKWANGYRYAGGIGTSPTFREAKSSRGWDTLDVIVDEEIDSKRHEAVEFAVNGDKSGKGSMPEPHRTAILFNARNLATGASVWTSPRLPSDPHHRAEILATAREMLMKRLADGGVI